MPSSFPRCVLWMGIVLALLGQADAQTRSDADFPPLRLVVVFKDSRTGRPSYGTFTIENHSMLYMCDSTGIVPVHYVEPGKTKLRVLGPDGRIKNISVVINGVTPDTLVIRVGQKRDRSKK